MQLSALIEIQYIVKSWGCPCNRWHALVWKTNRNTHKHTHIHTQTRQSRAHTLYYLHYLHTYQGSSTYTEYHLPLSFTKYVRMAVFLRITTLSAPCPLCIVTVYMKSIFKISILPEGWKYKIHERREFCALWERSPCLGEWWWRVS